MTDELLLTDLVLLQVIGREELPPTKYELWHPHGGLWNKALRPYERKGLCTEVNSDLRFNQSIRKLRDLNLIERQAPYKATMKGIALLVQLDDNLPLALPVDERNPVFERAVYI